MTGAGGVVLGWVVARTGGGFPRPVCPSLTSTTGPYPGCLVSQPPILLTIPKPHQGAGGREIPPCLCVCRARSGHVGGSGPGGGGGGGQCVEGREQSEGLAGWEGSAAKEQGRGQANLTLILAPTTWHDTSEARTGTNTPPHLRRDADPDTERGRGEGGRGGEPCKHASKCIHTHTDTRACAHIGNRINKSESTRKAVGGDSSGVAARDVSRFVEQRAHTTANATKRPSADTSRSKAGTGRAVPNGRKKRWSVPQFSQKSRRAHHVLAVGGWQLAVGDWRLVTVGGGWWWLVAVGVWGLVVDGGWQCLAVGGWSPLAIGGWWLAVDGPWGSPYKGGPQQKKNLVP